MREETNYGYNEITTCLQPLLNLLSEELQERVIELAQVISYRKHEMIYEVGANPNHLLCVMSGKVKIYCDGVGGRSQIMRVLAPGDLFGYRASLAQEPYVTAAAAFEPTRICMIPMPFIKTLMSSNNALCQFFVRLLATDLGISDQRTVSLTQKHMRGRMAEALLYLEEHFGTDCETGVINIQITREELAELSNMTTSNAIRTLSAFVNEGILCVEGRSIYITDRQALSHTNNLG